MLAAILKKKSSFDSYTTYAVIYILVTSVASGPILFYFQIPSVCLILYFAFSSGESKTQNINTKPKQSIAPPSLIKGYPQLKNPC